MTELSRTEKLARCKERSLAELGTGTKPEIAKAWASMVSDLTELDQATYLDTIILGMGLIVGGHLSTKEAMAKFINDFN